MKKISKKIFAFTLAEVMVVFMVIAVVAAGTIGIQKSRTHYADKFMSYAAFTGLKSFQEEIISEGTIIEGTEGTPGSPAVFSSGTAEVPAHYVQVPVPNRTELNSELSYFWSVVSQERVYDDACINSDMSGDVTACPNHTNYYSNTYLPAQSAYNNAFNDAKYEGPDGTIYSLSYITPNPNYAQNESYTQATYNVYYPTVPAGQPTEISPEIPAIPATLDTLVKSLPSTGNDLCTRTMEMLNTTSVTDCNKPMTDSGPFTLANANFVTSNGIRYFNFGSNPTHIPSSDTNDDNFIFTIYVDSNGAKGKSQLGDDVTKFYLSRSGKIFVPAPDSKMATDTSYLSATVRYRIGGNYTKLGERLTFQQATCLAGKNTALFNSTYNYCPGMPAHPQCNTATTNLNCEVVLNKPGF